MNLVPKKYKGQGLHNYCNACKRQITKNCGDTDKAVNSCKNKDKWRYKIVLHVPEPNGPGKKRTKICSSKTLEGAFQELFKFKDISSAGRLEAFNKERSLNDGVEVFLKKKLGLDEFKNQSKKLSKEHKQDVIRIIERFIQSLRNSGKNPDKMNLSNLDDTVIAPFYEHIEKFGSSSSVRDRHTRVMRNFLSFLINRGMYTGANFFKTVDTEQIFGSPEAVSKEEFEAVIKVTNDNNSWGIKGSNRKKNYYKEWVPYMFRLARLTGLRTEELYQLKWSDMTKVERGGRELSFFVVHNLKVERLKNRSDMLKVVPVTSSLRELLEELSNQNFSGNKVIETGMKKGPFSDFISRAFTHFFKTAFPGQKHKVFKQLRKSNLSDIYAILGEDAHKLTDHSGNQILKKHYIDKVEAALKFLELEQH